MTVSTSRRSIIRHHVRNNENEVDLEWKQAFARNRRQKQTSTRLDYSGLKSDASLDYRELVHIGSECPLIRPLDQ